MSFAIEIIDHPSINNKIISNYCLINYKKGLTEKEEHFFMYRSVILYKTKTAENSNQQEWRLLSFTTPKSLTISNFIKYYPVVNHQLYINEIILGTMIQLFYNNSLVSWEIATKSSIGGNYSSINNLDTFRKRFLNACKCATDISSISFLPKLQKNYSYQFVLTSDNKLYLVAVYHILKNKNTATYLSPLEYEKWTELNESGILFPPRYSNTYTYRQLRENYCSIHSNSLSMGIMITHSSGKRCRMLNPTYFERKKVASFNDNTFFHFLCFLRIGKIKDFIEFFPQYTANFSEFQTHYNTFIDGLYQSYLDYFVFKKVKTISIRYVNHIIGLYYDKYLPTQQKITKEIIQSYLLELDPAVVLRSFFMF
jgi:hypothetical protein